MESIFETIDKVQVLYKQVEENIFKTWQLTGAQWRLLNVVGQGDANLAEIMLKTHLDKSTISRQLNQLTEKDLVKKTREHDFRSFSINLTENGQKIYADSKQMLQEKIERLELGWPTEELQMLKIMLGRLERSFNKLNLNN